MPKINFTWLIIGLILGLFVVPMVVPKFSKK